MSYRARSIAGNPLVVQKTESCRARSPTKIRRSTPPIAEGLGGGEATGGSSSLKPRKQIFIF
ncbi:hypothetical protein CKA32_002455 [Geitlerinema sp. FC II]|nr:hypothetical protein CKA32_002455 [Geitlerinema sp. FC II]